MSSETDTYTTSSSDSGSDKFELHDHVKTDDNKKKEKHSTRRRSSGSKSPPPSQHVESLGHQMLARSMDGFRCSCSPGSCPKPPNYTQVLLMFLTLVSAGTGIFALSWMLTHQLEDNTNCYLQSLITASIIGPITFILSWISKGRYDAKYNTNNNPSNV